jgi:hypothetical protein
VQLRAGTQNGTTAEPAPADANAATNGTAADATAAGAADAEPAPGATDALDAFMQDMAKQAEADKARQLPTADNTAVPRRGA